MVTKMVTRVNHRPLGMGVGDGLQSGMVGAVVDASIAEQPKLWIGAAIGAIGGIASSLIGGNAASKAAEAARRERKAAEAKEQAWYNRRYHEDYLDTAAGQNLVRRAKDFASEQWKKAAGSQAVAGGTDAATAMAKDAGNKMVGDTIADIAASDTARKAAVDNAHMANEQRFAEQRQAEQLQRANNITNAAQNASNAMMSIGSAVDQASANTPNLAGGSNNSSSVNTGYNIAKANEGITADIRAQMQEKWKPFGG